MTLRAKVQAMREDAVASHESTYWLDKVISEMNAANMTSLIDAAKLRAQVSALPRFDCEVDDGMMEEIDGFYVERGMVLEVIDDATTAAAEEESREHLGGIGDLSNLTEDATLRQVIEAVKRFRHSGFIIPPDEHDSGTRRSIADFIFTDTLDSISVVLEALEAHGKKEVA